MNEMTGADAEYVEDGDFGPSMAEMEAAEGTDAGAADEATEVPGLQPLPRDEVERRWRQTQGALRSSRADLKALKAELAELRARGGSPDPSTPPDPNVDPLATVEWMRGQFVAAQEQQAFSSFVSSVEQQEAEMAQAYPDYHEALEFLRVSRRAELVDFGVAEDDVDQIVAQEFLAGVADARRSGLNPARVAFKLARDRGYVRRGRLSAIEAGSAAARTLSTSGGRGVGEGGSLEARIANLSGSALRDAWRRHKAAMS
jgi:hypothetical protein